MGFLEAARIIQARIDKDNENRQTPPEDTSFAGLFPATNMVANATYAINNKKATLDPNKPTTISQGKPEDISLVRRAIRAIPGDSRFEQSLENDFFEPLAKAGRFFFPSKQDYFREAMEENPKRSNEDIQRRASELMASDGFLDSNPNDPNSIMTSPMDTLPGPVALGMKGKTAFKRGLRLIMKTSEKEAAETLVRTMTKDEDIVKNFWSKVVGAKTEKEATSVLEDINLSEKLRGMSVRTADGSDLVTVGGKSLDETVESIGTRVREIFKQGTPEQQARIKPVADYFENITEAPSLRILERAAVVLKENGAIVDDIIDDISDLKSTMQAEPGRFTGEVIPRKTGEVPITEGPFRLREGEVKVESIPDGGEVVVTDGRFTKAGDIPVTQIRHDGPLPVKDGTYTKQGNVFVQGVKNGEAKTLTQPIDSFTIKNGEITVSATKNGVKDIPITKGPRYSSNPDDLNVPKYEAKELDVPASVIEPAPVKPVLDEVVDPVKENTGRIVADIQARFGKTTVTKGQVEKFKANEQKLAGEIARYGEEFAYVRENGGTMIQQVPKWVPTDLRNPQLFSNLAEIIGKGEVPVIHGSPEMELYLSLVDEVARRSGVKNNGPKPALNPTTAVLQAHRERTAAPGSPVIKREPGVSQKSAPVEEANMFEENGVEFKENLNQDEAYEEYVQFHQFENTKKGFTPPKKERRWVEELNFTDVKDVKGTSLTIWQSGEKVWGDQWPVVKSKIFDPLDDAKGRITVEEAKWTKELSENVTKGLGIARGSKMSAAVQDLGEGLKTYDQVVKELGKEKADKVLKAHEWFHAQYKSMLRDINLGRPEDAQIPEVDHYFRHFEELSGMGVLKGAFEDVNLGNLGDEGLWTKLKNRAQSFTKKRKGETRTPDAVGGFINYIPQYAYEKNMRHEIGRINAFIRDLSAQGSAKEDLKQYLQSLQDLSDNLSGEVNRIDVHLAELPYMSQRVINVSNYFNNRAKRNAVLLNSGSILMQGANMPQIVASVGPKYIAGAMKTALTDVFNPDALWRQGTFLPERFKHELYTEFSTGFTEKGLDTAGKLIGIFDKQACIISFNGHYAKGVAEGMSHAESIRYADNMTREMVGGRGIGETSILQRSRAFQVAAPFTLEQFNIFNILKRNIQKNEWGKVATFMGTAWAFNTMHNWAIGRDASFNPLGAVLDSYEITQDDEDKKALRVAGRLAGSALQFIPLGNYVANAGSLALGWTEKEREEFFSNQGDPVRYGNAPLLWNVAVAPAMGAVNFWSEEKITGGQRIKGAFDTFLGIGTPFGGKQAKNTIDGVNHLREENPDPMIDDSWGGVPGAVRNVLFGKWTPNLKYEDDIKKEMASLYEENAALMAAGKKDQVMANLEILTEQTAPIYEAAMTEGKKKEVERLTKESEPLVRTLNALTKAGKRDEALKIVQGLTEKEQRLLVGARQKIKSEGYDRETEAELHPESWIRESIDFAYAFGTNPKQAFDLFMAGEKIETTMGGGFDGMVTARRISESESQSIKEGLIRDKGEKATKTNMGKYKLEHKLPLTLGGTNRMENLEIVSNEDHDSWTDMEAYLGNAVKRQKIDYVQAQELILRFKGYEGTPITEAEIKKIVGVDKFPGYKASKEEKEAGVHRGWDDWGRNSLWLSDQDYSERDGEDGYAQGARGLADVYKDGSLSRD